MIIFVGSSGKHAPITPVLSMVNLSNFAILMVFRDIELQF